MRFFVLTLALLFQFSPKTLFFSPPLLRYRRAKIGAGQSADFFDPKNPGTRVHSHRPWLVIKPFPLSFFLYLSHPLSYSLLLSLTLSLALSRSLSLFLLPLSSSPTPRGHEGAQAHGNRRARRRAPLAVRGWPRGNLRRHQLERGAAAVVADAVRGGRRRLGSFWVAMCVYVCA